MKELFEATFTRTNNPKQGKVYIEFGEGQISYEIQLSANLLRNNIARTKIYRIADLWVRDAESWAPETPETIRLQMQY
jgi:hypothetical protein